MTTLYEFFVQLPNGHREYFKDVKKANEYAQLQANELDSVIARCDLNGGRSYSYPTMTVEGYEVYRSK